MAVSAAPAHSHSHEGGGGFKITFAPNVTPLTFEVSSPSSGSTAAGSTATTITGGADVPPDSPSSSSSSSSPSAPSSSSSAKAQGQGHLFPSSSTGRARTPVQRVSHTRKRPQNHIPRPPNSFILFRSEFIKNQHVPGSIETNHGSLSKIIGLCWRNLSFEERAVWEEKAKAALEEHKARYPDYKYRPAAPRREDSGSSKTSSGSPSKKAAAAAAGHHGHSNNNGNQGIRMTQMAVSSPSASERKAEDVAKLLLEGKRGDELDAAFKELEQARARQQDLAQPVPQQPFFSPLQLHPHLQHRRSSSAPPTDHAFAPAPAQRNSIVYAHVDWATAAQPRASLTVRSLALEQPASYGMSEPMDMGMGMDISSPAALLTLDTSGAPAPIAAELFGAFTQNPFAPAATLPVSQQQQLSPVDVDFNFAMDRMNANSNTAPHSADPFEMYFPHRLTSPIATDYPSPLDTSSGAGPSAYTYDLSVFPTDTVASSGELTAWAGIPAHPSPPAQMPDLIPPDAQLPYSPADYWSHSQQAVQQHQQEQAQYAMYNPQQQYYDYSQHQQQYDEPFSPTTPYEYDASVPVTPASAPILEPEEKALYSYIKDGLSRPHAELASPIPTAVFGATDFEFLSAQAAVY